MERAIAKRIHRTRRRLGMTLGQLAKVTGLSAGYLSQIENTERIPSIGTMNKIASGLNVRLATLLSEETATRDSGKLDIKKPGDRIQVTKADASPLSQHEYFGFGKPDRIVGSYLVAVGHQYPDKPTMHIGQEFLYILEGVHELFYDGRRYTLNAGDAVYFDSDRPHMGCSLSAEPAKVLVVYYNGTSDY